MELIKSEHYIHVITIYKLNLYIYIYSITIVASNAGESATSSKYEPASHKHNIFKTYAITLNTHGFLILVR